MLSDFSLKDKFLDSTILLVEDSRINQLVVLGILKNLGLKAEIATNGLEAIKKLNDSHKKYQLILMDCQMPEMDGYQATQYIRQQSNHNTNIIIIAMTANTMKGDKEKCLQAGMNDYITKPVNADVITKKLIHWLTYINNTNNTSTDNVNLCAFSEAASNIKNANNSHINSNKSINEDKAKKQLTQDNKSDNQLLSWDKAGLLKRLRYNQQMVDKLIAMFIEDNANTISNLTEAINDKKHEKIAAIAHKIKGSALNLSFNKLAEITSNLEKQAKSNEANNYSSLLASFIDEFSQLTLMISPINDDK